MEKWHTFGIQYFTTVITNEMLFRNNDVLFCNWWKKLMHFNDNQCTSIILLKNALCATHFIWLQLPDSATISKT